MSARLPKAKAAAMAAREANAESMGQSANQLCRSAALPLCHENDSMGCDDRVAKASPTTTPMETGRNSVCQPADIHAASRRTSMNTSPPSGSQTTPQLITASTNEGPFLASSVRTQFQAKRSHTP